VLAQVAVGDEKIDPKVYASHSTEDDILKGEDAPVKLLAAGAEEKNRSGNLGGPKTLVSVFSFGRSDTRETCCWQVQRRKLSRRSAQTGRAKGTVLSKGKEVLVSFLLADVEDESDPKAARVRKAEGRTSCKRRGVVVGRIGVGK
jgi:hypothetical protein